MKHNRGRAKALPKRETPQPLKVVREHDEESVPRAKAAATTNFAMLTSAGGTAMTFRILPVTPEMATRWLEKNHPDNRTVAWSRVEGFANDMRAGAWKLTHQAVAFGEDGLLIDGQHRLQALLQAADVVKSVEMLVIKNEAGTYHDPIDRGASRTIATILGMHTKDAAALSVLRDFETGVRANHPLTLDEADKIFTRHKAAFDRLHKVPYRTKLLGPQVAACVWALPCAEEKICEFAVKVISGEMIARGDAVFAFRSWRERNARIGSWPMALASLNCMRYFVQGVPMASVYVGESGYRAFTGRRRALKIPNTPEADVVPGVGWGVDARGKLPGAETDDVFDD